MSGGSKSGPRRGPVPRVGQALLMAAAAALPGLALVALNGLLAVVAVGSGLSGAIAAYLLLKEDGFLLPAAAFVSLGVALQLLLRFGGSIAGFAQRLWTRANDTWRDARRAWRESLSHGRGEQLE